MAERPDELNDEIQGNKGTSAIAKTRDKDIDNVYLESRSTGDDEAAATPADEITPETEQIKDQIEETRSNLGETINAIQERLSISNITEQVKDEVSDHISSAFQTAKHSVYEATIGKAGTIMSYLDKGIKDMEKTNFGRAASKNPLALSLIGLGLGMLLINGYSTKKRSSYSYNDYDDEDNYNRRSLSAKGGKSTFETAQNKVGDFAGQAYEGVSSAAGAVTGKAGDYAGAVSSTVGDYAGKVSGTVSDYAGQAYEQVGNLGDKAKDFAGSAQDQYEYYMDENPLAVGAVALALGAAVGMAFPSTQVENRLMGETREQLMTKAQETAREALGKVQQAAGNVGETVKQVAGEVAQTVQDSAGTVTDKVKEEAKNQV